MKKFTKKKFHWKKWRKSIGNFLSVALGKIHDFTEKHAYWIEKIQFTVFYFGCLVDLVFLTIDLIDGFEIEETMLVDHPFIQAFDNEFLRVVFSPDRVFLMTYFLIEFVIIRRKIKVSKLMQYHFMLTFTLLMCQGLALNLWDFFFNQDSLTELFLGKDIDEDSVDFSQIIGTVLFNLIFWFFFLMYGKLWKDALQGKFSQLGEGLRFISDSAAFWVRVKTPGLRKKYKESDEYEEDE